MSESLGFGQCSKIEKSDISHVWEKVTVPLGERSYDILIGPGLLLEVPSRLKEVYDGPGPFVITDSNVRDFIGEDFIRFLRDEGFKDAKILSFEAGERSKNIETVIKLARELVNIGADRTSLLLALGGGVVGDICGFLASIYMRGIPFIQLPTTLLAQVDSSVGGKTGVDIPEGKNLIGTFAQPRAVYADIGTLTSLSQAEIRNGISEIVKYGMIKDEGLFTLLEEKWWDVLNLEPHVTASVVKRSCEIKAEVVSKDEREGGYRRILNFGHTIGHAVEAASNYTIPHGEAVAMGMVAVGKISVGRSLLSKKAYQRLVELLNRFGLPVDIPKEIRPEEVLLNIKKDKKVKRGKVNFVLSKGIGETVIVDDVTDEEVLRAI